MKPNLGPRNVSEPSTDILGLHQYQSDRIEKAQPISDSPTYGGPKKHENDWADE